MEGSCEGRSEPICGTVEAEADIGTGRSGLQFDPAPEVVPGRMRKGDWGIEADTDSAGPSRVFSSRI